MLLKKADYFYLKIILIVLIMEIYNFNYIYIFFYLIKSKFFIFKNLLYVFRLDFIKNKKI